MGLNIQGRYELEAPTQEAWAMILNPEVLRECIPGCSDLEADSETSYRATVTVKVGPIKATFKGRVELSEIDEPHSLRLSGAGEGGVVGNAKGTSRIELTPGELPNTCILEYDADVAIGGKLAQLGSRLIEGVARKLADQFFGKLAAKFDDPVKAEHAEAAAGRA